ncbi:unnamed protein product [Arctia plantaginis]|uniref:Uncharacterized protein n=1 Tax=Arctia plantaginis TaxID=874455 RepID=A0A8S0ZE21_ARCPL|nr:unnamed protein product [Arctia plantaginis]
MSSTTLKCNVCNIVIDELLAYIQNKISVSDEETIVKICASTFASEQIEKSNKLLLESLPAELRKSNRKGKVPGAGINLKSGAYRDRSLIYLKSKHDTAVDDKCGNQFLDHEAINTSHKKFTNLNYGEGRNMPIPWPTQKDRCESAESKRARPSSADG